ncbi:OmpA family protein [Vreelandella massiliensis]|uniref:OmpA family protein n=1 Tax=Vreelandella massiliensis TaxID=1816686 RepID=UPI00096AC730|nr:OmpA family protein [Halomonas massiliensis]MYL24785.1 OmpA family protein [Halomonas alkaliantarctica]
MLEDHRSGPRHDSLMKVRHDDDSDSVWMVSYIDIMTLLVALFVIIIVAAEAANPGWLVGARAPDVKPMRAAPRLEVPLPEPLAQLRKKQQLPRIAPGELSPMAISAALGVAGLPPRVPAPPRLLARPELEAEPTLLPAPELPRLMMPSGFDLTQPLAEFMVVLTDRPPANVVEVEDDAIASAQALNQALTQRVEDSLYLPDLAGVEVSRVSEGINLRVQDQLLFPSSDAALTGDGEALVASLVDTIQRYDGKVSVEGHSDSRPINTEEFPSNWALSSARAIAIVEALEAAGVATERLRAVGLAATEPLADNDTAQGRARNRRVEVVIHVE